MPYFLNDHRVILVTLLQSHTVQHRSPHMNSKQIKISTACSLPVKEHSTTGSLPVKEHSTAMFPPVEEHPTTNAPKAKETENTNLPGKSVNEGLTPNNNNDKIKVNCSISSETRARDLPRTLTTDSKIPVKNKINIGKPLRRSNKNSKIPVWTRTLSVNNDETNNVYTAINTSKKANQIKHTRTITKPKQENLYSFAKNVYSSLTGETVKKKAHKTVKAEMTKRKICTTKRIKTVTRQSNTLKTSLTSTYSRTNVTRGQNTKTIVKTMKGKDTTKSKGIINSEKIIQTPTKTKLNIRKFQITLIENKPSVNKQQQYTLGPMKQGTNEQRSQQHPKTKQEKNFQTMAVDTRAKSEQQTNENKCPEKPDEQLFDSPRHEKQHQSEQTTTTEQVGPYKNTETTPRIKIRNYHTKNKFKQKLPKQKLTVGIKFETASKKPDMKKDDLISIETEKKNKLTLDALREAIKIQSQLKTSGKSTTPSRPTEPTKPTTQQSEPTTMENQMKTLSNPTQPQQKTTEIKNKIVKTTKTKKQSLITEHISSNKLSSSLFRNEQPSQYDKPDHSLHLVSKPQNPNDLTDGITTNNLRQKCTQQETLSKSQEEKETGKVLKKELPIKEKGIESKNRKGKTRAVKP